MVNVGSDKSNREKCSGWIIIKNKIAVDRHKLLGYRNKKIIIIFKKKKKKNTQTQM